MGLTLHLGPVHVVEGYLMAVLVLLPFAALAAAVALATRHDRRRQAEELSGRPQATREASNEPGSTRSSITDTAAPHSLQQ